MLELLETFCTVAEAGSLSRAAERLHRTQPSVTRQVQVLERRLGVVLIRRTPYGVELTPAGSAALPHAHAAVASMRACREAALSAAAVAPNRLRLTAGPMAMRYLLPSLISRFRIAHPEIDVDLQAAHQQAAVGRLLAYQTDAAIIASPVRDPQVRAIPLLHDPLVLVGPPSEVGGPVELNALQGRTVLTLAAGTGLHEQVESALRRRGVACTLIEHPEAETIKTAITLGMGVSLLPLSAVREEVVAGRLSARSLAGWVGARRTLRLLIRAEGNPSHAVAALLDVLREPLPPAKRQRPALSIVDDGVPDGRGAVH